MRILVVTQNFWPENFPINDFCRGLKERGHEVVILTGKPNYPKGDYYEGYTFFNRSRDSWEGMTVYRCGVIPRGKGKTVRLLLNYFSFAFFASLKVFSVKGPFDRIFVYQPSPVTVGIPAIVAKWRFRTPFYFWVQDLWPGSLTAAGGVNNKFILYLVDRLTRFIYRQSKYVLMQSEGFRSYIRRQGVPDRKLKYLPNSTEEDIYRVVDHPEKYGSTLPKGFKLMFAGNIGEAQGFQTLLEAALILKNEQLPVKWIILGDGRMKPRVEEYIQTHGLGDDFFLWGSFPASEMPLFFSCADALVVSLKKMDIFALTIPSKVQAYMACGRPIIASLDGEGAKIIKEAGAGFSTPAEDSRALAQAIRQMYQVSETERKELGKNARRYYEQEFQKEKKFERLNTIMELN